MLKPGYKQTDLGVLPEEWEVVELGELGECIIGLTYNPANINKNGTLVLRSSNIQENELDLNDQVRVKMAIPEKLFVQEDDLLVCVRNGSRRLIGKCLLLDQRTKGASFGAFMSVYRSPLNKYIVHAFKSDIVARQIEENLGATINSITNKDLNSYKIPLPPPVEQQAIAEALGAVDTLLTAQRELLAKKRDLKQAARQVLLSGEQRLPGFAGEWATKTLQESTNCLDNLRVPLNDSQRTKMHGNIPYCGANGIVGFVNDYIIDDNIILMAEDGGYFDEFATRPIAYQMTGKCWVNNHAHILKAKIGFIQNFIFHSIVHKDISQFIANGTRAKLNRSELNKIEISFPPIEEQRAIATILSDMDAELEALATELVKTQALKQGLMQDLLTGTIRLTGGAPLATPTPQ